MLVKNIKLKNYRNYTNLSLDLSDNLNIIIGDNAQGKTNILESIYVLGLTKSFITNTDKNLIKYNSSISSIKGEVISNKTKKKLSIIITEESKKIKINSNEIKKHSDYISKLNIIIWTPNDLKLIKDNPLLRRKFLNIEISQLNYNYLIKLSEFNYVLRVRNELLKYIKCNKKVDDNYFSIITEKYVDLCIYIYFERKKFINNINESLSKIYKEISGFTDLRIKYVSNVVELENIDKMKLDLLNKIKNNRIKEVKNGMTLYGIHRDDFKFELDDNDLSIYGSQGQQRLAVLALKLSEINIFKDKTGEYPILLLDDLFSELDNNKKNRVIKYLNLDIQTIITSTDVNKINRSLIKCSKLFKVINNEVEEMTNGK